MRQIIIYLLTKNCSDILHVLEQNVSVKLYAVMGEDPVPIQQIKDKFFRYKPS